MFAIDTTDIQRVAISSLGAIILSAACVMSAVGPARAADGNAPLTTGDWQAQVERSIDQTLRVPDGALRNRSHAATTVAVNFDADGRYAGATIARSSRDASVDREALRVAKSIAYPVLPSGLRGKPQNVAMQISVSQPGYAQNKRGAMTRDEVQTAALR